MMSNKEKARKMERRLVKYGKEMGGEDLETLMADMYADMRLLAHFEDMDFDYIARRGDGYFDEDLIQGASMATSSKECEDAGGFWNSEDNQCELH